MVIAFAFESNAQASYYNFSETTGNTFSSISATGTALAFTDDSKQLVDLGFSLTYNSADYTQVSVSSNGYLRMGDVPASNAFNTIAGTTPNYLNLIGLFWDDLNPSTGGTIYYEIQGTAPNRTFILEYNAVDRYNPGGGVLTAQAVLYETSNNIEFMYGSSAPSFASASIGLTFTPGGASNYISVTPGTPATVSSSTPNNAITIAPADGVNYLFTYAPPACPAPSVLTASNFTLTSADLGWTENGSAGAWDIEWGVGGFTPTGTPNVDDTGDNPYTLMGLSEGTDYEYYVRADCGSDNTNVSTWAGPFSFTTSFTAPECAETPFPADGATDVAVGALTFTWTAPTTGVTPTSYNLYVFDNAAGDNPVLIDNFTVESADLVISGYNTDIFWGVVPVNGTTEAAGCDVWSFTTGDAPIGAVCDNSIVVTTLPYTTSDDTSNYGDDYGTADRPALAGAQYTDGTGSDSYLTGDDVVYSFTPAQDGQFNFELILPTSDWYGFWLFEGCAPFTSVVAYHTASSGSTRSLPAINLIGGTTYYVVISTWPAPQSTPYTLNITENTCSNATVDYAVISDCGAGQSGGFLIDVTVSDLGTATDITIINDQDTTEYNVSATGTYQFGPFVNGTDVIVTVTDDNDANCTQSSSALTRATCPPANDDCTGAIALTPGTVFESNALSGQTQEGATDSGELPLPSCSSYDPDDASGFGGDVWYSVVVPADGNIEIETQADPTGSGGDSGMSVYSGTCGSLTEVDCDDDDSSDGNYSLVSISDPTLANQTLYIRIFEYSGNSRLDFQISAYSSTLTINEFENTNAFTYFPNPVKDIFTLRAQSNIQNVSIYNMLGQEVLRTAPNSLESVIKMNDLQTGAYFVKVRINDSIETIRVIKQ